MSDDNDVSKVREKLHKAILDGVIKSIKLEDIAPLIERRFLEVAGDIMELLDDKLQLSHQEQLDFLNFMVNIRTFARDHAKEESRQYLDKVAKALAYDYGTKLLSEIKTASEREQTETEVK